jgi:hypothetical protein
MSNEAGESAPDTIFEDRDRPRPPPVLWEVACPSCGEAMEYQPAEREGGFFEMEPAEWPVCECGCMFEPAAVRLLDVAASPSDRINAAVADMEHSRRQAADLAMLVRMLYRHVPGDKKIKLKVANYLRRHGLQGSPLRTMGS